MPIEELRTGFDQLKVCIASLTEALATARAERDDAIARADALQAALAAAVKPDEPAGLSALVLEVREKAEEVLVVLEIAPAPDSLIRTPALGG